MKQESGNNSPQAPSRRKFIGQIGTTAAVTFAAGAVGIEPLLKTSAIDSSSSEQFKSTRK